jgi:transposase-like protein
MDTTISEQDLRRMAIQRRLQGERPCDICRVLGRTRSWFYKWWGEYQHDPDTDFSNHSRAPKTSPQQTSGSIEQAIVSIRKAREAGRTAHLKFGFIGHRTIQADLERFGHRDVPSLSTIQRLLAKHDLTHPLGAAEETAYYPWPTAWEVNAIQATDIITRHLRGGLEIQNVHTIDHYSHAVHLSQYLDKTSETLCQHLLESWAKLGLPFLHQTDNEGVFCGGHTHPRVIGKVVRLCLFCGIEPLFIPEYEAKRNYQVETFHGLWCRGFWSRCLFRSLTQVQTRVPTFGTWYHREYRPPALAGQTPQQMRQGFHPVRLTARLQQLIPAGRLPITVGRIHVIRKVDCQGSLVMFNERWSVHKKWIGEYVWAVIDTASQQVDFWHLPEANTDWIHLKTRAFELQEPVQKLLPEFYRNRKRCREHLPG